MKKITIKDSTGVLLSVPIKGEETFRELDQRMEKEHGMRIDFSSLKGEKSSLDLDENILIYLSKNNRREFLSSNHDLNLRLFRGRESKEFDGETQLETIADSNSLSFEEVVQIIPEGYDLMTLDGELEEEICDGIDEIKYKEMKGADDGLALLSNRHEAQKYEQNSEFSKVVFELIEDKSSLLLCRLCATSSNDTIHMFEGNDTYKNIVEKIVDCLPIAVKKNDNLPKQVCRSCLEKLESCHLFNKTVTEAEKQLLILSGKIFYESNDKGIERLEKCQTLESSGRQRSAQKLIHYRDKLQTYSDKTASAINAEEFKSVDTNGENSTRLRSRELLPSKLRSINNSVEESARKDSSRQVQDADYSEKELRAEVVTPESKRHYPSITKNANAREEDEKKDVHFEAERVENETISGQIIDSRMIKCRICETAFQTVKKCHIHSSVHASKNYYPCCVCEKTFKTEKDCNEHSSEHIEGKKFERRASTHVCDECGKKFVSEARLKFHKIYHNSESKPCYCKKCDKIMASESSLYQHMLTVHRQYKEYCCDICGKQFRAQAQLGAHQRKHKDERPFECTVCEKRFYSNDILRRHKMLHLPDKPYQCDQCGKRFDRNNTLTKHLLRHRVEAGESMMCHVCSICKEVFVDIATARIHMRNCRTNTEDNNDDEILELNLKEMYRCEYCEKCYTEIKFMKNHRSCHVEPSPYVCTVCDTTYATYNQATAHKTAHKRSSKITTVKDELVVPKYFACEHCDKRFLHFTNMNIHRRSCSSGKTWTCRYCGTLFENARELSIHKKGETGVKSWVCNECNSSFGSECAFEIHRETHSGSIREKKSFLCLHCGKTFTQKAHLTIHIRSHTGERPYSCDLCDKSYKIKTERDNHRRTHSGEKPYKCSICEKTFANTARLREHTRFHSGKRPYSCSLCNQSFKKANARNVHMTIHTGEKPYQCDVCGTNFRRTGDMRKHKRTQHGQ